MKKLKAAGVALLYLVIPFLMQLVISMELAVQVALGEIKGVKVSEQIINKFEKDYGYNLILVTLVNLLLIVGMGLWYYFIRKRQGDEKRDYKKILSGKSVACLAGAAFSAQFACNIVIITFSVAFPKVYENYAKLMEGTDINVLPAGVTLFIVAIWAPLAEEIVFRGMIFRTLRKGFSFWAAVIISGLVFGMYHMNWIQGVYATILGCLLAVIYEKTDSLLGAYLFHLLFNLFNYLISFFQKSGLPDMILGLIVFGFTVVSVPGVIFFMMKYVKMFQSVPQNAECEEIERKENVSIGGEENANV